MMRILQAGVLISLCASGTAVAQYTVLCGAQSAQMIGAAQYDPTAPNDAFLDIRYSFFETSGSSGRDNRASICSGTFTGDFYTWDQDGGLTPSLRGLNYEVLDPSGAVISYGMDPGSTAVNTYSPVIQDSQRFETLRLRIPAGQIVGQQNVSEQLQYYVRQRVRVCSNRMRSNSGYITYSGCGNFETRSSSASFSVSVDVLESLSMNIAGAGTAKTIDFGTLEQGATRQVNIQSQANSAYRITFDSEMGDVLKLSGDPQSPDQIVYTASLDGQAISSSQSYVNSNPGGTNGMQVSLPFEVTIGDTANKRAGVYSDLITLRIESVL